MREIRLSGSEGGAGFIPRSYPYLAGSHASPTFNLTRRMDKTVIHNGEKESRERPRLCSCLTILEFPIKGA